MKTPAIFIRKQLLLFLLSICFTTINAFPIKGIFKSKKDTSCCLEIYGRISFKNQHLKGSYKAELIYFDETLDSVIVRCNRSFKFSLKRNSPYIIRISKPGFTPRLICVNTKVDDSDYLTGIYTFFFETELIAVKEAMLLDNEALELPAAIVSFNKKTGRFDHNRDYTSFVKQKIKTGM